jgi:hypothetical protein
LLYGVIDCGDKARLAISLKVMSPKRDLHESTACFLLQMLSSIHYNPPPCLFFHLTRYKNKVCLWLKSSRNCVYGNNCI